MSLAKFTKYDDNKIRFDLLYGPFISGMAQVMTFGAQKYDNDNWVKCTSMRRYFSALLRHLWTWWFDGEDLDPESGLHHAFHAGCCLMMLFGLHDIHGSKVDDRLKKVTINDKPNKMVQIFRKILNRRA